METVWAGGKSTSSIGLGCGGFSRLGIGSRRSSEKEAQRVVRTAYELGIRFFDTAEVYGTESVLGDALCDKDRSEITLCSKVMLKDQDNWKSAAQIKNALEDTLRKLKTDYLDVYYLHAVMPEDYDRAVDEAYPLLESLKREGKIRMIGISEMFGRDMTHEMMERAVKDSIWDALMVGYNLLNQGASSLLRRAGALGIFRVNMFAVRKALVNNEQFGKYMDKMIGEGRFRFTLSDFYEFKDELFRGTDSVSFPGLAYRFVRDEDLFDVILTGTGSLEHLKDNIQALEAPSLSGRIRDNIKNFYKGEVHLSGQEGFC